MTKPLRIRFNFPRTRFVLELPSALQAAHVASEALEAASAEEPREAHLEHVDLLHSLETYFRILEIERGAEYVVDLFAEVERKNRGRGYYGRAK